MIRRMVLVALAASATVASVQASPAHEAAHVLTPTAEEVLDTGLRAGSLSIGTVMDEVARLEVSQRPSGRPGGATGRPGGATGRPSGTRPADAPRDGSGRRPRG